MKWQRRHAHLQSSWSPEIYGILFAADNSVVGRKYNGVLKEFLWNYDSEFKI